MDIIGRGIIAGFLATLVLAAVLDPVSGALRMADILPPSFAWILHFFVGSFIWGAGFAALQPLIPGPTWLRGLVFGVLAWLVVMLAVMPLAQAGSLGLKLGFAAASLTLLIHIAYGGLLGLIFGLLDPRDESGRHRPARSERRTRFHLLHR